MLLPFVTCIDIWRGSLRLLHLSRNHDRTLIEILLFPGHYLSKSLQGFQQKRPSKIGIR